MTWKAIFGNTSSIRSACTTRASCSQRHGTAPRWRARAPAGRQTVAVTFEVEEGEFHSGGAGLFSTGLDYLAFTRMLLAGGTLDGVKVLREETVKLMAHNAIGDLDVPMVRATTPRWRSKSRPSRTRHEMGAGFLINTEDVEGFRSAGSLTWGGVRNTYCWIDLKKRISAVALMQI